MKGLGVATWDIVWIDTGVTAGVVMGAVIAETTAGVGPGGDTRMAVGALVGISNGEETRAGI